MSESPPARRHRCARPARTPFTDLATGTRAALSTAGRRTGAAAGAAALLSAAVAGPASAGSATGADGSVDTRPLTAAAHAALKVSPVVSVPVEATWSFQAPAITVVADPPPPPPVVEAPRPRAQATTSRATAATRTAPAEAPVKAPAALGAPAPASANGSAVVEIGARYVGAPYLWGGTTPDGFDCSGFTQYVYAQVGISLPRTSSDQRYAGTVVPRDQAAPGDLIWTPGHIAIYAGGDQQIDSPLPGGAVSIRSIYQSNPIFIRVG